MLLTLAVTALVGLGVGVAVGAAMWAGGDHGGGDAASHGPQSGTMDELGFLAQMVPHHESAIEMAELARTKAQRPAIRRLAEDIIEAQETEIADMQAWHRDWHGEELVPRRSGMHDAVDKAALETTSGPEFERAFLRMMVSHHAGAILMADAVMMGSPRQGVAMLAEQITATQAKEIGQMQRWREAWFPPLG